MYIAVDWKKRRKENNYWIGESNSFYRITTKFKAVFDVDPDEGLTLIELREGHTIEDLIEQTEAQFKISPDLKPLQQA